MSTIQTDDIVIANQVCKSFKSGEKTTRALDNVSLYIKENETVAVVGESGSGKTTLARAILNLVSIDSGTIQYFDAGKEIEKNEDLDPPIQIVFQNPISSLNPRLKIQDSLEEALVVQRDWDKKSRKAKIIQMIDQVGLSQATLNKYPKELSGGQAQRVAIARALVVEPKLVILDEAVSALDVTIQRQILNLLEEIQKQTAVSYLFISHDLRVVQEICNRTVVMYQGRIVEENATDLLFKNPKEAYTKKLMQAVPRLEYI